jgi:hypothetical protein
MLSLRPDRRAYWADGIIDGLPAPGDMTRSCAARMVWSTAVPEDDVRHRVRRPRRDAVGGVALLGRLWFGIRRLFHGLG